jgi:hypothetical protein
MRKEQKTAEAVFGRFWGPGCGLSGARANGRARVLAKACFAKGGDYRRACAFYDEGGARSATFTFMNSTFGTSTEPLKREIG